MGICISGSKTARFASVVRVIGCGAAQSKDVAHLRNREKSIENGVKYFSRANCGSTAGLNVEHSKNEEV